MIDSEAQVVHCTAVRSHMGILGSFLRLEEKGQYRRLPHGRPTCGLHAGIIVMFRNTRNGIGSSYLAARIWCGLEFEGLLAWCCAAQTQLIYYMELVIHSSLAVSGFSAARMLE